MSVIESLVPAVEVYSIDKKPSQIWRVYREISKRSGDGCVRRFIAARASLSA